MKMLWTTKDLETLPQQDWMTYEIIEGELFTYPPRHWRHQLVLGNIVCALHEWSKQTDLGTVIFSPGIEISEINDVIPDGVWISKERLLQIENDAGHLTAMPEIVIEVLSSGAENIRRDRETKLKLYSVQGAPEYWIVDRFSQQIEIYRQEGSDLTLTETLLGKDVLKSPLLPRFAYDISKFFV